MGKEKSKKTPEKQGANTSLAATRAKRAKSAINLSYQPPKKRGSATKSKNPPQEVSDVSDDESILEDVAFDDQVADFCKSKGDQLANLLDDLTNLPESVGPVKTITARKYSLILEEDESRKTPNKTQDERETHGLKTPEKQSCPPDTRESHSQTNLSLQGLNEQQPSDVPAPTMDALLTPSKIIHEPALHAPIDQHLIFQPLTQVNQSMLLTFVKANYSSRVYNKCQAISTSMIKVAYHCLVYIHNHQDINKDQLAFTLLEGMISNLKDMSEEEIATNMMNDKIYHLLSMTHYKISDAELSFIKSAYNARSPLDLWHLMIQLRSQMDCFNGLLDVPDGFYYPDIVAWVCSEWSNDVVINFLLTSYSNIRARRFILGKMTLKFGEQEFVDTMESMMKTASPPSWQMQQTFAFQRACVITTVHMNQMSCYLQGLLIKLHDSTVSKTYTNMESAQSSKNMESTMFQAVQNTTGLTGKTMSDAFNQSHYQSGPSTYSPSQAPSTSCGLTSPASVSAISLSSLTKKKPPAFRFIPGPSGQKKGG